MNERVEKWSPDFKVKGNLYDRLCALLSGEARLDAKYQLADLSVLRDRFLAAFPEDPPEAPRPPELQRQASAPPALKLELERGVSGKSRHTLLRLGSRLGEGLDGKVERLDLAHRFQEQLERNGRTEVSLWQLDIHFERFKNDPRGAVEHCAALLKPDADRTSEDRRVQWTSTFEVLRRLGLEEHAYEMEDKGYKYWHEWRHLGVDELKECGLATEEAKMLHHVICGNAERPDVLRQFQIPEFSDLVQRFAARFPATEAAALQFAQALTDELGAAEVSCFQVEQYLAAATDARDALLHVAARLPRLAA